MDKICKEKERGKNHQKEHMPKFEFRWTGHIDGKEIALVEWIREGRVPLQAIQAKIDCCYYTVQAIYGVLGIKNLDII
ncbi:hypothetical protein AAZX31_05G074800 [Glycine max]|uniref:Small ribosomal subunit protein uS3 C-terminal domain-containing protein n=1 Tax=Glycine max TaxID=3847 RepID=A0A0R0JS72_SOYBN|nr:hypothetical protein GYH30_011931 [Glycine max]